MRNDKYIKKIIVQGEKSSPDERARRLRMLRNLANLSRDEMAIFCGINASTLKSWELGRFCGLPQDGAEKIVHYLTKRGVICSTDWLIHEIGAGPKVNADFSKASEDLNKRSHKISTNEEKNAILEELLLFKKLFGDAIDFMVEDDAMEPEYKKGEYVAGIKRYRDKIATLAGSDCIIQTINGQTLIRNLRLGDEKGKYTLMCTNTKTQVKEPVIYNAELSSAALIIRHLRYNLK